MSHLKIAATLAALCFAGIAQAQAAETAERVDDCANPTTEPLASGCALLDKFMAAFNDADPVTFAATNHYPHIRITGPKTTIWNTAAEYEASNPREGFVNKGSETQFKGWVRSAWSSRQLVQYSDTSMHFTVVFDRLDADDKPIATFNSLYILTNRDGEWGIQARSSFAGIANGGAY